MKGRAYVRACNLGFAGDSPVAGGGRVVHKGGYTGLVVEEGIESQRSWALITPRTRKPQGKILVRRAEREANYMP